MSKPMIGQLVELWDGGKPVKVRVYKVSDTHVTVEMPNKKLWSMTLNDFTSKLSGEGW